MSEIPSDAVLGASTALSLIQAVLVQRRFSIQSSESNAALPSPRHGDPFGLSSFPIPTVWIEEQHQDVTVITEHPVEGGAPITDHAYARPSDVTIRLGWKGESQPAIQTLYSRILELKNSRTLFEIQTGKRLYKNMLIAEISVMTDQSTANVLMATVRCRQIILVNTQVVSVPSSPENQAEPSSTTPATNQGATTLKPGSSFNEAGTPPETRRSYLIMDPQQ